MSEVATKNITFWNTTGYNYPGFGKTVEVPDGLGGTISITYNRIDYDDRAWRGKPDGDTPVTPNRFLSGEIENKFSLTGKAKAITSTMPLIRNLGNENNYSVTLDFSKYKASAAGSKATDGATSGDTYLAISRFFNGSKAGYTTIKVTAKTLDGSELNLGDWKLFNSGTLGKGNNSRIFLDAATQTISGKNSQGKQELSPTPPNPGSAFGTDTALGLFELPSNQRYVSITLSFKQKKIQGVTPNDLHDLYVASNTSSTSPIDETPETKPIDINNGLQLHLPLNEIVENTAKKKEVVDVSPGKLNGKVNGATVVADSRFGSCINFDGVDDYIELPKETIPQTGEITISFWAYGGKSLPKNTVLISAYNQGNQPLVRVYLPWSDRRIIFDYGNPHDRIEKLGEAVDFKDKWSYWTFTKNVATGEMNIYLNGSLWHSGTGKDKAIDSVVQVMFGREIYNSYYNGKVAHLRIYDRVLSPEEINECMKVDGSPPPIDINNGLQLHLPLNEIVENAAKEKEVVDVSAGKLNGKVNGATVVADSRFGSCINFDGVDDYIELPTTTIPQTGEITISFWANGGKSLPKYASIILAEDQGSNRVVNIHLPWSDSTVYFDCGNQTSSFDRIQQVAQAFDFKDKWTYWVFTKNVTTGEMKIYQNGTLWQSGTGKNTQLSSVTRVRLGCGVGYPSIGFYDGKVAHLRIYNRVLSPEEINECMKVDGAPPPMDINRGLQLHLPLNEIVENAAKEKEVVDISAGKLNGKVNGATVVAEPRFGNCLNFNGIDDCVIVNPMANFPSEAITVLSWVRSNNKQKEGTVVSYAKSSTKRYNEFQIYNIKNITPTVNNKWHSTGVAVNDGEWHCVAITWQSSDGQFKVYKDGKEVHSKVISKGDPIATGGALVLGQEQDKLGAGFAVNQAFQGQMAHLRVYNRVLSPEEINECIKVDGTPQPVDINSGLQLHLPLNEIVENASKEKEVVDISAAKLKGKVNGNPKILDDSRFGSCLEFDGVDDHIQMPEMNLDYSQGLTIGVWVHYNSFKSWSRIIDFGNGTPSDNIVFANETTTSNLCFDSFKGKTSNRVLANGKLELSKWLHLAVTVDGSGNTKIYTNGTEVESGSINLPNQINRTKNYIGKSNWPDEFFYGKMSNLRLYNRPLSKAEINECMEVDQNPQPVDINRGLQLHLPLNEIVENASKEKEVVDISAAKLKGKVNGNPKILDDSRFGSCLDFDGVDDHIQMPEMNIDYSQGVTVGAWVHYNSFKSWSRIIDFGNGQGNDNILLTNEGTTKNLLLDVYQGATQNRIKADGKLELNQWLYVTVTVDGSGSGKIYKNGEEVQGGLVHLPNNLNRTKNYIGKSNWSADEFFHGKMSNLRLYNRALSKAEINECMEVDQKPRPPVDKTPPPMDINRGLQVHLPLNEIVENAAKEKEVVDISPSKLNGKVHGATVVADSRFGDCINFDGVDDYIELPVATIPQTGEITISFWANGGKSLPKGCSIISGRDQGNNVIVNIELPWSDSMINFDCGRKDDSADRVKKIGEAVDFKDKWHNWVFTKNVATGEMQIYQDGVLWQNTTGKNKPINSITQVKFGTGYGFYDGKVAHLRIYDRVLSPEEINECMKVDGTPPPMDINRGLQLHLPLNEIVENAAKEKEVVDISPSKLNGKVHGATVVADSRFGDCINFDGVDDYIELPVATIPQTGEITISFWANGGKSLPKGCSIISGRDRGNNVIVNIELPWSDSMINFDCGRKDDSADRVKKIGEAVDFKDKWHNWVFTKNVATGEMQIYQDGVLWQNTTGKNKPINSITQVKFGTGYGFYDGKVAHLRIYDRVLSPEEINECMKVDETPPPMDINRGLQLHLPLNEIVENAAKEKEVVDISASKLNGKVNGATVVADSTLGNCLSFDGVDDYIQMPEMNIDYSKGITIEAWVHYENFKNWSKIIDFAKGPGDNNIVLRNSKTTSNGLLVVFVGSTRKAIEVTGGLELSQWVYLTATIDESGNAKIYKNGQEVGGGLLAVPNSVNRTKNYVGRGNWSTDKYFQGKMSNLRVYNRPLSPEEINECMKVDRTPPPMDINSGLQLHLPLNEIVENATKEKEVVDASGKKLNGKVHGNPEIVVDSRFGNCINFDGVDDYIELPVATIPQTGEITISFWANGGKSLPKYNSIIVAYDGSNHRVVNIHLPWSDSKIYFDCGNTTTSDDSYDRIDKLSQAVDFKDKWTHWVFTKNVATGEMKIYQNGSLWHSGTGKNKPIGSVAMVKLGCDPGTLFYHGKVANLRIYDRVLSPEEINEYMKVDETGTTSTTDEGDGTETKAPTDTKSSTGEGDGTETKAPTDTKSTTGEGDGTETKAPTDTKSTIGEGDGSQTKAPTDTKSTIGEGDGSQTKAPTDTKSTTGEGDGSQTKAPTDTKSTTGEGQTDTSSTTDPTDTTQKPMEYQTYQVKGNPTIKTGYPASEWTAVIAGFNCGAKQKHKATALTIMPVVDDGEWKIKCDIKDADDRYWDVAVLFIRNNMVNRLNNFYR